MKRASILLGILGCLSSCSKPGPSATYAAVAPAAATQPTNASPMDMAGSPMSLEIWATVHGSSDGPLRSGMALSSGDRIDLVGRTSAASTVFLVYCDTRQTLALYPPSGGIALEARERRALPAEGKQLRLDDAAGNETLYIVASRFPLRQSDPALESALARSRSDGKLDCGGSLEDSLAGPKIDKLAQAPLPRITKLVTPVPVNVRGLEVVDGADAAVRASAGSDGIIVLRFSFQHRR